jgi:ABC-type Mn2+/Zn2+ transport system ATPase subunit
VHDAPFLQVNDLNAGYNGSTAIGDISFEVETGDSVAVVGPNGAGKSTLFKVIAGVLAANSGTVKISGHKPEGHICIAYVPQRSEVDWDFPVSVADVVMMGRTGKLGMLRRPKQADWDYVDECLGLVGLEDLAGRQINELSGGQQQRMFIAQTLAQEAELLLLDEPFTGLDLTSQEEVFGILETLSQRGVTVMVATHDLGIAAERFDRVMLLNTKLEGYGTPGEIFTEERLRSVYGGHLQMIPTDDGMMVIDDTCCDD